jgi:small subunit ribosomal protein S9
MADDDTPAGDEQTPNAVPSDDAAEIAGSAEDAALEAAQEAQEAGAGDSAPDVPAAEPAGDGHAVPSADAQEIAGSAEDAALEAAQEAQEATVDVPPAPAASAEPADAAADAGAAEAGADAEGESEPAPREKPAVPGAHLEVDIVPEGVDPLSSGEQYVDPYALDDDGESTEATEEQDGEETLAEPISTAAIDLASGARYRATGKRKTAIARVTLRPGKGSYLVNGRTLEQHFPRETLQRNIRQPLETVGYQDRMDVVARLHGGGISAQAGALRHGVSRALLEADPNLRGELKRRGFLTRDSRAKERKKAGLKKARKKPQFSKR